MLRCHAGFSQAGTQPQRAWRAAVAATEQYFFHDIESRNLVGRGKRRTVRYVIGVAGKGVERMDMLSKSRTDQRRPDREILVAAVLAGPGFHGGAHACVPG